MALLFMKQAVRVQPLALEMNALGAAPNIVYPVLIWDDNDATLIDTGFPGQFEQLTEAVNAAGIPLTHIRRIFITHQDWDHIGTIPEIIAACGGAVDLYAHIDEKPYLEGTLPYIKITPERAAARLQELPAHLRERAAAMFARIPTARITHPLIGGEHLAFHGGIDIIHTPGHTPGHICLYLKSYRLLIAGDQLRVENGCLVGPAAIHTPDMPLAQKSLAKLLAFDIDSIICYHGGMYRPGAADRIAELAAQPE